MTATYDALTGQPTAEFTSSTPVKSSAGRRQGAVRITLHSANNEVDEKAEVTVALSNPEEAIDKMLHTLSMRFPPESVMTIAPTSAMHDQGSCSSSERTSSGSSGATEALRQLQQSGVYTQLPPEVRHGLAVFPQVLTSWVLATDPVLLPDLLCLSSNRSSSDTCKRWASNVGLNPEQVAHVVSQLGSDQHFYSWVSSLAQATLTPGGNISSKKKRKSSSKKKSTSSSPTKTPSSAKYNGYSPSGFSTLPGVHSTGSPAGTYGSPGQAKRSAGDLPPYPGSGVKAASGSRYASKEGAHHSGGHHQSGQQHGGLTHGGMTPGGMPHGGMPQGSTTHGGQSHSGQNHGGQSHGGKSHGGMTHGNMTHSMSNAMESVVDATPRTHMSRGQSHGAGRPAWVGSPANADFANHRGDGGNGAHDFHHGAQPFGNGDDMAPMFRNESFVSQDKRDGLASHDGPDGMRVRYVEIPVYEDRVIEVMGPKQYRERIKEVKKIEYRDIETIIEEGVDTQIVEKKVDKEVIVDDIVEVTRHEVRVIDKIVERRVPKIETVNVEKVVNVPVVHEVPTPYEVKSEVHVPRYVNRRAPAVVAQKLRPMIRESNRDRQTVDVKIYEPTLYACDVYVPKPVVSAFVSLGKVDEQHRQVEIPAPQYNSLLKAMNTQHPEDALQDLFVRAVNGIIPLLPPGELVEVVAPVMAAAPAKQQSHARPHRSHRRSRKSPTRRHHRH